jgi:hypothetical protein
VVVDFEPERPPVMNLVIANLDKTMARDVRIDADPPFQSSQDQSHPESLAQLKIFIDGIPALPPGKRIVLLFDLLDRRPQDLPRSYWVTVRYEWDEGDPITEKLRLDLDLYNNLVSVRRYGIHDIADQLKKSNRVLDRWSAAGGGLLVVSPAEKRRAHQQLRALAKQEQATADGGLAATAQRPWSAGCSNWLVSCVATDRRTSLGGAVDC